MGKIDGIRDLVLSTKCHIFAVTKTCLSTDPVSFDLISNYHFISTPCPTGRGGGTGLFISNCLLALSIIPSTCYNLFEYTLVKVLLPSGDINVCVLYRPLHTSYISFLSGLSSFLSQLKLSRGKWYFAGDFNIDLLRPGAPRNNFLKLMSSYSLTPAINGTRRITLTSSSLLDNIFTNSLDYSACTITYNISDHLPIFTGSSRHPTMGHNHHPPSRFSPSRSCRDFSTLRRRIFVSLLNNPDWVDIKVQAETDFDSSVTGFLDKYIGIYLKAFPEIKTAAFF